MKNFTRPRETHSSLVPGQCFGPQQCSAGSCIQYPSSAAYGMNSRILNTGNREQLDDLSRFVADSYLRDENGDPIQARAYGETRPLFSCTKKISSLPDMQHLGGQGIQTGRIRCAQLSVCSTQINFTGSYPEYPEQSSRINLHPDYLTGTSGLVSRIKIKAS
jgi:hypothetical protein